MAGSRDRVGDGADDARGPDLLPVRQRQPATAAAQSVSASTSTWLRQRDALWFCFFYAITFGGFVGLASSLGMFLHDQYGVDPCRRRRPDGAVRLRRQLHAAPSAACSPTAGAGSACCWDATRRRRAAPGCRQPYRRSRWRRRYSWSRRSRSWAPGTAPYSSSSPALPAGHRLSSRDWSARRAGWAASSCRRPSVRSAGT